MSVPTPLARVLTLLNLKGGVGKTHASWLFAGVCQERAQRLLIIDLDPQANLTSSFVLRPDLQPGVEMVFDPSAEPNLESLIRTTEFSQIDIIPANPSLARFDLADQRVWEVADLQFTLRDALRPILDRYSYVVLDCPPRLSLVSIAALCASDGLIVPLEAADWGARGVTQVREAYEYVRANFNPHLRLTGYVVSRFRPARTYQQSYLTQLRKHFGAEAMDTTLNDMSAFERSVCDRIPVNLRNRRSRAADIARAFFDEIDRRLAAHRSGRAGEGSRNLRREEYAPTRIAA